MKVNEDFTRTIERLRAALVGNVEHEHHEAAMLTGGLPVYADLGGILAITPDLQVKAYDPETRRVSDVTDATWRRVALVSASEKYSDLAGLHPPRPTDATNCMACGGSGRQIARAFCRACGGLGWVASSSTDLCGE
jgi:hypothetical protein